MELNDRNVLTYDVPFPDRLRNVTPHELTSWPLPSELTEDRTERLSLGVTLDGLPFSVVARWQIFEGRAEPVLVTVFTNPPRPVTAEQIRRLPIGSILAGMRRDLAWETDRSPDDPRQPVREAARRGPQRGRPWVAGDLKEVAGVYREAWTFGRPVTESVAKHFAISASTASKRIMAARKAGLLDGVGPKR